MFVLVMDKQTHPFERAGLGRAPFKFVGHYESKFQAAPGEPVKAGTSCDYCATAIMQVYRVRGSDGREFKVGSDCISKVDAKLTKAISVVEKKRRAEKAEKRAQDSRSDLESLLADETVRAALAAKPSPVSWRSTETLLDHVLFVTKRCGDAGRRRWAAKIRAEVGS